MPFVIVPGIDRFCGKSRTINTSLGNGVKSDLDTIFSLIFIPRRVKRRLRTVISHAIINALEQRRKKARRKRVSLNDIHFALFPCKRPLVGAFLCALESLRLPIGTGAASTTTTATCATTATTATAATACGCLW